MTTAQFISSNLSSQSATPSQRFSREMQLPLVHPNSDVLHYEKKLITVEQ
jgi:hypothetical protein